MKTSLSMLGLGIALSSVSLTANAQETQQIARASEARSHLITPAGASVAVGGGVSNYARESIRDITGVSGTWEARLTYGTRSIIGGELSYVGGMRSMAAAGLANDASLLNNGVEAAVRVNLPFELRGMLLEPFVFAGVGYSHYNLRNAANASTSIANSDNVGTIPLGLGFAFGWKGLFAEARAAYRPTFDDNELVKIDKSDLQSWALGANLGFEF